MKKIFTLLLTATLALGAWATGDTTSDGLSWDLTDNVLTISGTGAMMNYANSSFGGSVVAPWRATNDLKNAIKYVVIGKNVSHVGNYAFYSLSNLESVTFENGSTCASIGNSAFAISAKLTNIELPSTISTIGMQAFQRCSTLVSVTCNTVDAIELKASGSGTMQVFAATANDLKIYVPASSVATYKDHSTWSTYADRIVAKSAPTPGPDPEPKPTLTVSTTSLDFGTFEVGTTATKTFTVSGENLTNDVTITLSDVAAQKSLTLDKTTITKAELAEGPVTVTVGIQSTRDLSFSGAHITIASEGAESKTVSAKGTVRVIEDIEVPALSTLSSISNVGSWADKRFTYTGTNAKISSLDKYNDRIIIKDASAQIYVNITNWDDDVLFVGNQVSNFVFTAEYVAGYMGDKVYATPITLTFKPLFNYSDQTTAEDLEAQTSTTNVAISRALSSASFNTICLPFAMSYQEVEDVFGSTTEILALTGSSLVDDELCLDFEECSTIEAGKPYLIKPAATIESWIKYGATISTTTTPATTTAVTFVPVLTPTEVAAANTNLMVGAGNTLFYPNATGTLKGMRAYFQVTDPAAAGAPARIGRIGNTATGIQNAAEAKKAAKALEEGRVIIRIADRTYDLNGHLLK